MDAQIDLVEKRIGAIRFLLALKNDDRLDENSKRSIRFQLLRNLNEVTDTCASIAENSYDMITSENKPVAQTVPIKIEKKVSASSSEDDLVENTKRVQVKPKKTK